jgi:formate dehydrogenase maturation protein FdhE
VYSCRKCGKYLKTVDQREFEIPAPLEVEQLATLHLDAAAVSRLKSP